MSAADIVLTGAQVLLLLLQFKYTDCVRVYPLYNFLFVVLQAWLLNALHAGLGGSKKRAGTSIIHQTFQGLVQVHTSTRSVG